MSIPPEDLHNLDHTIAVFLVNHLTAFRDQTESYPADLDTLDDWRAELTDIIDAWQAIADFETDKMDDADRANLHRFIDRLPDLWE